MAPAANANVLLITGANSGVGYEAAKLFLESDKPYHVLAAARSDEKAKATVERMKSECPDVKNTVEPITIDVTNDEDIQKAYEHVNSSIGRLDTLINNAGANLDIAHVKGEISLRDAFTKSYDANVSGAHVTAMTFVPLLLKSSDARLIFVSGLSQITNAYDDSKPYFPTPELPAGWPKKNDFETIAYRCTKCALNMLIIDWNHKLKNDNIKVFGMSPGMTATNLGGLGPEFGKKIGAQSAGDGARIYKAVVEGERDHQEGKIHTQTGLMTI